MKKPNLSNFGKGLKFTERVSKKKTITEKELFIEIMDMYTELWARSNGAYDKYKINLLEYEEQFYQVIEGFILIKYGLIQTEVILWYIFARQDEDGEIMPLTYKTKDENGEKEEKIIVKTSSDLWDVIQRIDRDSKIDN